MTDVIDLRGTHHAVSSCITCGVVYTVPLAVWNKQREDGGFHYCPNGHSQGWSKEKSENEKTRRERDRLKQQLAQKEDEIAEVQRALVAQKGQVTRLKNRAKAGLCPCCNRHFTNLQRHMASKHAEEGATLQ